MMMRTISFLVLLLLLVMCATPQAAFALTLPPDSELELVQIIHRHGARSAIVPANASVICPRGCGELNQEGKDMLVKVGEFLRERYNDGIAATDYFPTESYDQRLVYSRSTDLSRTIQSADGILRGLFPNLSDFFPVVHTVQFEEDLLLLIDAMPSYHVPATQYYHEYLTQLTPFLLQRFSLSLAADMGEEASLMPFCGDSNNYAGCILALQDIAATRNAEGRLSEFPLLQQNYQNLSDSRFALNSLLYPYNASNYVDQQRGSLGQTIVQRMLANIHQIVEHGHSTLTQKMMHYSAHDTTMMPVCTTLGHNELMLPLFGFTVILELLHANSTDSFYVRAVQALPGQTPDTDHNVTSSVLSLTCITAANETYHTAVPSDGCLLEDFIRYVNTTAPQSADGVCFVDDATLKAMDCDTPGAPKSSSLCAWYRSACPAQGCRLAGHGAVVNTVDLSCVLVNDVPLSDGPDGMNVSRGVAGGIAAGVGLAGVLIGFAVALLVLRQQQRKGYETVRDKNL